MTRSLRKFARDGLVTVLAAVLLFVGNNLGDLGLPPEVVAFVSPVALLLYRLLREQFDVLARVDDIR